jgi:hypothetical protein
MASTPSTPVAATVRTVTTPGAPTKQPKNLNYLSSSDEESDGDSIVTPRAPTDSDESASESDVDVDAETDVVESADSDADTAPTKPKRARTVAQPKPAAAAKPSKPVAAAKPSKPAAAAAKPKPAAAAVKPKPAAAAAKPKPAKPVVKTVNVEAVLPYQLKLAQSNGPDQCPHFVEESVLRCLGGVRVVCGAGGSPEHQRMMERVRKALMQEGMTSSQATEFVNSNAEYVHQCGEHLGDGTFPFFELPGSPDCIPCLFLPTETSHEGGAIPLPVPTGKDSEYTPDKPAPGTKLVAARTPASALKPYLKSSTAQRASNLARLLAFLTKAGVNAEVRTMVITYKANAKTGNPVGNITTKFAEPEVDADEIA